MSDKIEFVSYDGEYPCLCYGELKVRIDGEIFSFHYSYSNWKYRNQNKYPSFWTSGGSASFDSEWNENITQGEWQLNVYNEKVYPKKIRDNLCRLVDVMNENVIHGCCGGCV